MDTTDHEDTPQSRDIAGQAAAEEEAQAATQARSDHLMDLARSCDTEALREEAIEVLEGVRRAHEPPPPPRFRW